MRFGCSTFAWLETPENLFVCPLVSLAKYFCCKWWSNGTMCLLCKHFVYRIAQFLLNWTSTVNKSYIIFHVDTPLSIFN